MKKILIIWNLILTLILAGIIFSGCSELDPKFAALEAEVENNRAVMEQIVSLANQNRQSVSSNTQLILQNKLLLESYKTASQNNLNALQSTLIQYIEQRLQAYAAASQQITVK